MKLLHWLAISQTDINSTKEIGKQVQLLFLSNEYRELHVEDEYCIATLYVLNLFLNLKINK